MGFQFQFYEGLKDPSLKEEVWEILCECDKEFIPHLSSRESSVQSMLTVNKTTEQKPKLYFNEMLQQHFILCQDEESGRVVAFLSYRNQYDADELKDHNPSNYITTICTTKSYRNKGITRTFYEIIFSDQLPEQLRMPYVTTRTWSTNDSHIHILNSLDFDKVRILKNHRGENVDTIYFSKKSIY
ncbi:MULTISPECIES: GNAT family N-acetyltransferase [unclassified Bacillus (in: firmicutes)]|uniref:GNAT family N-acetyltransferase n=1 Tax=unclassified Bacillus (in: firmicutes) TaxID=185979 RepID=UPI0008EDFA35|nr:MULTISPECIES: GNAT family N-acetyltransferase [unclassified Bacillus (in: firmicutes)]SFB09138.1 Ribosomal protein S18 acetylase RimI [Bacillus sp. UNCCL13]SFQ86827.1 Ribosomal protein S18 acetylase RimI [Bacillus sp. cl95]